MREKADVSSIKIPNKIPILDLKPQYQAIKSEIKSAINTVLESGQFVLGPTVAKFESEVARYLGVKHAIGVNSGTDALIIALRALGIGSGDEVITTCFSFFATAEAISNVGAKPAFVDIEASSFNIDPGLVEAAITSKTKAIMPVHLYGNPAALTQIKTVATQHNLKVIEDCAQSFGAVYKGSCSGCQSSCEEGVRQSLLGKQTGSLGDMGAFSFFPTKNLGAYGDGGLITTDDDQLADLAMMLRTHGSKQKYCNEMLGYNSRLDAIQAAVLHVKLDYINLWNQQRRQVAETYSQLLEGIAGVITPALTDGHVFHQYTIRVLDGKRDHVQQSLAEAGISSMVYYPFPQDRLPIYDGQYPTNPVSDEIGKQVLSLPMWPELSAEISQFVVKTLRESL